MKKWLVAACLIWSPMVYAADIVGTWRTIDDKTGFSKALVEIRQMPDGTYSGTITKILPRPGYIPKEFCQHCPSPYTSKPILGLNILTGLIADAKRSNNYISGKILDPLSGNIYKTKARLNLDGHSLTIRGYVGISALGRSQTWIRED